MRIYNPTYKKIAINWDSVELPVNEGTPFSADGTIANTSDAIGLCPVYIWKKPIDEEVYILIGGDVYQSEVEEAFGAELTDDAIASMGGINFYENDGTIDKASGGGGGGSTNTLIITFELDGGVPSITGSMTPTEARDAYPLVAILDNRTDGKVCSVFDSITYDDTTMILRQGENELTGDFATETWGL